MNKFMLEFMGDRKQAKKIVSEKDVQQLIPVVRTKKVAKE